MITRHKLQIKPDKCLVCNRPLWHSDGPAFHNRIWDAIEDEDEKVSDYLNQLCQQCSVKLLKHYRVRERYDVHKKEFYIVNKQVMHDNAVLHWIAEQIKKLADRVKQGKMVHMCHAKTITGQYDYCFAYAIEIIDDMPLCHQHIKMYKRNSPSFSAIKGSIEEPKILQLAKQLLN